MEREHAGDSGATNTSSSHHKDPGDGTAQVEQEKDDVPPPSPIQRALGQVSYCTSHDTPQYKDICLLYSFIKLFINLEDWLEYNLERERESYCFFLLSQVVSEVLFPTRDSCPGPRTPVLSNSLPRPASTPPPASVSSSDALKSVEVISQLLQEAEGELQASRSSTFSPLVHWRKYILTYE